MAAAAPPARAGHALTYDAQLARCVLVGGDAGGRVLGDVWLYDGAAWTPAAALPPRSNGVAAAAPGGGVLAFGGSDGLVRGDLWQFTSGAWRELAAGVAPPARRDHGAVFQEGLGATIVFGGRALAGTALDDTWAWDGRAWTQLRPAVRPPARASAALAAHAQSIVLFGGEAGPPQRDLGDTWTFDGAAWTQASGAAPAPRRAHAMAHDSRRERSVLFGGWSGAQSLGDTWEWDGSAWRAVTTSPSPPPRARHALAYDAVRGVVVLFGGRDASGTLLGDTWTFDGVAWRAVPTVIPPPLVDHAMTWDAARERVVLHGGVWWTGASVDSTFEWDGATWVERVPSPRGPHRSGHSLAFDPRRREVLSMGGAFGGAPENDLLVYVPLAPAACEPFGTGCVGAAGTPALAPHAGGLPWLGDAFALTLTGVGNTAPAVVLLGTSRATWRGAALPLDLGFAGMPGCHLHTAIEWLAPLPVQGGRGSLPLPIPLVPDLAGRSVYAQAIATDAGANAFGAVTSNARDVRIGAR